MRISGQRGPFHATASMSKNTSMNAFQNIIDKPNNTESKIDADAYTDADVHLKCHEDIVNNVGAEAHTSVTCIHS
jgi:hypothetical protein